MYRILNTLLQSLSFDTLNSNVYNTIAAVMSFHAIRPRRHIKMIFYFVTLELFPSVQSIEPIVHMLTV